MNGNTYLVSGLEKGYIHYYSLKKIDGQLTNSEEPAINYVLTYTL